jgi:DNA mismatch endonuclease, patch repair protein
MSEQRREGTGPELALRQALHSLGLRRKADIVFGPARVAVFVDGCFWHGCPEHGRRKHDINSWYWPDKIARNQRRDEDTDQALSTAGWAVIRLWEHEVSGPGACGAAERVLAVLRARQATPAGAEVRDSGEPPAV